MSASPQLQDGDLGERVRSLRLPETVKDRRGRLPLAWTLCALLAALCVWLAFGRYVSPIASVSPSSGQGSDIPEAAGRSGGAEPAEPPVPEPNVVGSQSVTARSSARDPGTAGTTIRPSPLLESKGYIVPRRQVLVSPQVSGRLVKLNVEEGRRVEKGDELAVVDATEYKADYDRAEASSRLAEQRLLELEHGNRPEEIEQARAELAEARAQLPQLESEYERLRKLYDSQAITRTEWERAESAYLAMKRRIQRYTAAMAIMELGPRAERIEAAKAEVAQAHAELAKAKWRLDNCVIRAPISGTILRKNAEEGNLVNPIAFNGSFSICDIADLDDLEVDLNIQEREISRIFPGQKCRIRADAYPDREYEGVVSRLLPIADRAKGAIAVRVTVAVPADDKGLYLKPEMSVVVSFLAG